MGLSDIKYAFILVPLIFMFTLYVITNNAVTLFGLNFLVALLGASIITVITTSMIPLTGNSEGTYLSFVIGFALIFWGISIANFSGFGIREVELGEHPVVFGYYGYSAEAFNDTVSATTLNVQDLNFMNLMPSFGGWSGSDIWLTITISLSFFYALGLYLIVANRGK